MKKIFIFFLLFSITIFSQKKNFEVEDLYKIKTISNLNISPNGKLFSFSLTEYNLKEGKKSTALWISDIEGKKMFKLTSGEKNDTENAFSPDSKNLVFLSDRDGEDGIYLISLEGGEAKKIFDFKLGISSLKFFPSGKDIFFVSSVFPECEDKKCNEDLEKSLREGPLKAHLADSLLYRHWNFWNDGKKSHILKIDLDGNFKDITLGDYESPLFSISGDENYSLSRDGKFLFFASKRVPNLAETTNSDIFMQDLKDLKKDLENLTDFNKGADKNPLPSPDGKYLAYLTQKIEGYESDLWRIGLIDLKTKKAKLLTERNNFDNWINKIRWGESGKFIYFTAQVKGETPLYKINIENGKIEELLVHQTIDDFEITPDENFVIYIHRAIAEPVEIYKYDLIRKTKPIKMTRFNEKIMEEVDIRPAEKYYISGADGKPVQVFLIKPHNFDPEKKYPCILNIHGGPQSQWQDSFRGDWQVYPGAGYVLAFPNPHGSTGFGQEYTEAISGDWGGKVYEDIMKVTDWLESLPFVDKERIGAMGWSYGGYMINWILGHTDRYKCLASMMGVFNLSSKYGSTEELWFPEWDLKGTPWDSEDYIKWDPSRFVKNFKTPTLVITGEKDFRVPYTQSLELFTALQKMRVPSRLIVFEKAGHWPSWYEMAFYYIAHLDWFHKWLGGAPPSIDLKKFWQNRAFDKKE